MADPNTPGMRPPGNARDPEARDINPFKQALNAMFFGTTDPSHRDVGEFRAKAVHRRELGLAQAQFAGSSPAMQAAGMREYGAIGAQAAQAMRERYYQKEYKQMMSAQINPLIGEIQQNEADGRALLQTSYMPVPRTVGAEEAAGIAAADAAGRPGTPQILKGTREIQFGGQAARNVAIPVIGERASVRIAASVGREGDHLALHEDGLVQRSFDFCHRIPVLGHLDQNIVCIFLPLRIPDGQSYGKRPCVIGRELRCGAVLFR